eukprot:TRINITY_DN12626_c2_g3_i1.p1 TRINITY_DN12626_c2_g3~~TRINITY_DN12626_c2_g3_i1.p1  ORF type:complete len:191 (+),score=19.95 TRINITY_DN12626_c2_g3_i1:86-658(+)
MLSRVCPISWSGFFRSSSPWCAAADTLSPVKTAASAMKATGTMLQQAYFYNMQMACNIAAMKNQFRAHLQQRMQHQSCLDSFTTAMDQWTFFNATQPHPDRNNLLRAAMPPLPSAAACAQHLPTASSAVSNTLTSALRTPTPDPCSPAGHAVTSAPPSPKKRMITQHEKRQLENLVTLLKTQISQELTRM